MSFPSLPPIPGDPELLDLAGEDGGCDFVDRGALQWALLGEMPMEEGEKLAHGEPPRGEYAGFGEGCALEPEERPPAPVAPVKAAGPSTDRVRSGDGGGRRVAPPLSRRLTAPPRALARRREPRLGGMWVFLSSAAASVMILLLSSLAVIQYGDRSEEPALTPPVLEPVEGMADSPVPGRPPGLAATVRGDL